MRDVVDTSNIPGWGVDADPENDPTYPMRDRSKDGASGMMTWERPAIQETDVEILRSIEHNRRPAVVGTSVPPSGISGMIRRAAFKKSESNWWHWLMLMGADRVNVVEGVVQDLARAKIPNIPAEMGVRAEWKHNKKGLVTKLAVMAAVGVAAAVLLGRKGDDDEEEHEAFRIGPEGESR